ncbi:MAG: 4-alpha-glucanotransferase, partial [Chloroflexota bacterium]
MDKNERNGLLPRASGILAHPTSLPGPHGVGDLGAGAYAFLDFLAKGAQRVWQILPLGQPGLGNSPYSALSAFAGNALLISLARLLDEGLLSERDLAGGPRFSSDQVDYEVVTPYKLTMLRRAYERFARAAPPAMREEFASFRTRESGWLGDYALFIALKAANRGVTWNQFGPALARREPDALVQAHRDLADDITFHEFVQYQFFRQWTAL